MLKEQVCLGGKTERNQLGILETERVRLLENEVGCLKGEIFLLLVRGERRQIA